MHVGRLLALVGAAVGVVGLFMPGLRTEGEELLPALHQANPAFPDGVPTIWGGLDTWAQVLAVVLIVVIVVLALRPPIKEPEDRVSGAITTLAGVAFLIYAIIKLVDTVDKADALRDAFAQAAGGGAIPVAFDVAPGFGFLILIIGTGLVAIGGVLSLIANPEQAQTEAAAE